MEWSAGKVELLDDAIAAKVSDAVYGAGWNGVPDIAPSKNAVYDKVELLDASISAAASRAEQEAGTEAAKYVAPATQRFHPSACKAFVVFDGDPVAILGTDYNVTSITDLGVGDYRVTWDTNFSNVNYVCIGMNTSAGSGDSETISQKAGTPAVGAIDLQSRRASTGASIDPTHVFIAAFGDQ